MNQIYTPHIRTDVCVIGGSATGVFAAVRAAKLGAKVMLIEKQNCFGGTATSGLVNVWHTLYDADGREQIIFGLTQEVEERLARQGAAEFPNTPSVGCRFQSARLACVLDDLIPENGIVASLHTIFLSAETDGDRITSITALRADGIVRIEASFFIDCSGDGALAFAVGVPCYTRERIQPPSSCFLMRGLTDHVDIGALIKAHGEEYGLDDDWGWSGPVPGVEGVSFRADNHIFGVNCANAEDLTKAEMEGRRKARAFVDLLKTYVDPGYELIALCSSIGIRETRHFETRFCATETELLLGTDYEDSVMRGTYRVDIHHAEDNGITFKYLNGEKTTVWGKGSRTETGNWRDEMGLGGDYAKCYHLPFRALVQEKFRNLIAVGRMIHADEGAFGALRVMVNLNQLGEAAGIAAALCCDRGEDVRSLDGREVAKLR